MSAKRFPASARKLKKLRKDGDVPTSRMLVSFAALVGVLCGVWCSQSWVKIGTLVQWSSREANMPERELWSALGVSLWIVVWGAGAAMVAGLGAAFMQSGGLISLSLLVSGFRKAKPSSYLSRLREGITDGALGCIRSGFVLVCLVPVLIAQVGVSGALFDAATGDVIAVLNGYIQSVILRGMVLLGVISLVCYMLVRWRYFARNRMSLEELREEYKQDEGDPHVRAARRHEHQMLAMGELEKRVRNAKVIVVRRAPQKDS